MQILQFDQYAKNKLTKFVVGKDETPDNESGQWFGIAIGPRSDEGRVLVDGHTLQAGRVLALRGNRYQVARAVPYDASLACIQYLELVLFESLEELSLEVARPSITYPNPTTLIPKGTTTRFTCPFVGRNHVLVNIQSDDASALTYTVKGLRFHQSKRAVVERALKSEFGVAFDTNKDYAFYIDDEQWDAIALDITTSTDEAADRNYNVDFETTGELGVRY